VIEFQHHYSAEAVRQLRRELEDVKPRNLPTRFNGGSGQFRLALASLVAPELDKAVSAQITGLVDPNRSPKSGT
jgi:hypothetical protein